jgi:hypothetical protein
MVEIGITSPQVGRYMRQLGHVRGLLSCFHEVIRKNIRVNLFMKSLTLHIFLYTLCLDYIYYKTDLEDSPLYHSDSEPSLVLGEPFS